MELAKYTECKLKTIYGSIKHAYIIPQKALLLY